MMRKETIRLLRHRALLHHLHWHDQADTIVTVKGCQVTRRGFTGCGHRFHDLRHGAAVRWLRARVDSKTVQVGLGHASTAMALDRCAHHIGQHAAAAAVPRLDTLNDAGRRTRYGQRPARRAPRTMRQGRRKAKKSPLTSNNVSEGDLSG